MVATNTKNLFKTNNFQTRCVYKVLKGSFNSSYKIKIRKIRIIVKWLV